MFETGTGRSASASAESNERVQSLAFSSDAPYGIAVLHTEQGFRLDGVDVAVPPGPGLKSVLVPIARGP